MAEMLDTNLPQSIITRIIKENLPENIAIGKDVKAALTRAATMFILYIMEHSSQFAQSASRKTVLPQDIFNALKEADFEQMCDPLQEALNEFRKLKQKKEAKEGENGSMDDKVEATPES